ncbi:hypothetical protein BIT18_2557, partial [Mycobacterium tuberculosis variant bovis]
MATPPERRGWRAGPVSRAVLATVIAGQPHATPPSPAAPPSPPVPPV